MIEKIKDNIVDYVVENFSADREEIFLDESLIDQGIIDSTGLIEIVSFIEEKYSLVIEEQQYITENFGSIIKIANFIFCEINKHNTIPSTA